MSPEEERNSQATLLNNESIDFEESWDYNVEIQRPAAKRRELFKSVLMSTLIVIPWTLIVLQFLGLLTWSRPSVGKTSYYIRPHLTYSPLQDIIDYELKIFTTGLPEDPDFSPYAQEPSDEVDQVWKDLYPSVFQLIPIEEARKLPNKTVIYPHDEKRRYAIELDVFHQLHCLNMVRKATRPDYYQPHPKSGELGDPDVQTSHQHIAHCIDAIRQSIMCASDVTAYTWQWEEGVGYANQVKNAHTCRNFEAIKDWAVENTEKIYFDNNIRVMNDPLDPDTWEEGYMGE